VDLRACNARRNGHRAKALLKQTLEVLQRYNVSPQKQWIPAQELGVEQSPLDRRAKYALETVFVDHGGYGCFAVLLQRADHSSGAIHEHVTVCPQNNGRKNNAETDDGANTKSGFGVEKNAAGGNVGGFSEIFVGVRGADRNGEPEWKSNRATGILHPMHLSGAVIHRGQFALKITFVLTRNQRTCACAGNKRV